MSSASPTTLTSPQHFTHAAIFFRTQIPPLILNPPRWRSSGHWLCLQHAPLFWRHYHTLHTQPYFFLFRCPPSILNPPRQWPSGHWLYLQHPQTLWCHHHTLHTQTCFFLIQTPPYYTKSSSTQTLSGHCLRTPPFLHHPLVIDDGYHFQEFLPAWPWKTASPWLLLAHLLPASDGQVTKVV